MSGIFRAQPPIDLHLHSNLSDGTDSPTEVVRAAHSHGVRTMALTDHDITAGWREAADECSRLGMTFIPGAELSVVTPSVGGMHLLAYLFDAESPRLLAAMGRVHEQLIHRASEIVSNLQVDFDIDFDEVLSIAGRAAPQKPHIAEALVRRGHAADTDDVFARILYSGSPYSVPKSGRLHIMEAIELVKDAGGVSILAHPCARTDRTMPKRNLEVMLEAGLGGLELDHQENRRKNPEALATLWEYHRDLDFIVTGSSDYHGHRKANRPGDDTTSEEMLQRLIESARGTTGSAGTEPVYPPAN